MRVENDGVGAIASGDLYLHDVGTSRIPFVSTEPDPASGVPAFPFADYRYYLRVTRIEAGAAAESVTLTFDLHRFEHAASAWTTMSTLTADLRWTTAPAGFPASSDYLTGQVRSADSGGTVATMTMGWVSSYLRRALVEIDRVATAPAPLDNGAGVGWRTVFDAVGWDITVIESDADIEPERDGPWSNDALHAAMLARRDNSNATRAMWVYHVLAVGRLAQFDRGVMYDSGATDSNNVPREGVGIASDWTFPNSNFWGRVKGMRFGDASAPYLRTALHEIGHAMGLAHNTADLGIMNTTDMIALRARSVPFPLNVRWSFAADDRTRLRHLPDVSVRPGGIPSRPGRTTTGTNADDLRRTAHGLRVVVAPVLATVPLGAPVRIDYALVNGAGIALPAPANLRLRSGFVSGRVVDPSGTVRAFSPIVLCLDEQPIDYLAPEHRVEHSATLLRGPQGALFPMAGPYRVLVDVDWEIDGIALGATGETVVMVTPLENHEHAEAALKTLTTPDAVVTLALGGDHLPDGVDAIQAGAGDPVLGPHYAAIEVRRRGSVEAAENLLNETSVLAAAEIDRITELVQQATPTDEEAKSDVAELLAARKGRLNRAG